MIILAVETGSTRTIDSLIQTFLPKILLATIFFFLIYLINYFSNNFAFIFQSNISIQNISSLSFNFYFLSVLTGIFLLVWILSIYRSVLRFFNSKFRYQFLTPKINYLFKCDIIIFAFTMYLFLNYFVPKLYLLFGLISVFQTISTMLSLTLPDFPAIITYPQYSMYISNLLLISVEFLGLSGLIFFILHGIYFFHRKVGLNDFLSWTFTLEVGKAFLYFLTPFSIIYIIIWYNLITNTFTKLLLLLVILGLLLFLLYKITSTYYYGIANSWVNNDNSVSVFVLLIVVFYIFPVLFWYLHDFIFLYINHTAQTTVLVDFQTFLLNNNIVPNSVFSAPWTMDPIVLLILTLFEIHRILFVDVFVTGFFSFLFLSYMQFTYILTYFKSLFNKSFKEKLHESNKAIYDFNAKIQKNIILNILFWVFILFLSWDVLLVVYNTYIQPLSPSTLPDASKYIIVYVIMNNLQGLQYPTNYFSIFLVLLLFIAVLIVFNTVSIKLNEEMIENSLTGVFTIFSFSFVLIISYLIYDLQHYTLHPLMNFQLLYISNVDYSYYTVLMVGIICDSFLMVILLTFIAYKLKRRLVKPSVKTSESSVEEKAEESEKKEDEGEKLFKTEEKKAGEEDNPSN